MSWSQREEVQSLMSLRRSCIEDVLDVIREIQRISSVGRMEKSSTLRGDAIRTVANRELSRKRFSHRDSAERSIHDACARRLNLSTGEFDELVEEWLLGNPARLRSTLLPKAKNTRQEDDINSLLKVH